MMIPAKITDKNFWDIPKDKLLEHLGTSLNGLSSDEAALRLKKYGPNTLRRESRYKGLIQLLGTFNNPLVIILLVASVVAFATGGKVEALIIIVMVLASTMLNFHQEYTARHAVEKLRRQVASTAAIKRDGVEREIAVGSLVPGDIVILNAGDLIPADARLLKEKDLHVRESALTGESLPVEKDAGDLEPGKHGITEANNSVFLGTSVQTGIATAVVVRTGGHTEFGAIAAKLAQHPMETEFERGIRKFSLMITRIILLLVSFVFLINLIFHRPFLESFLFAIALAVGLTPELLPMITTITLSKGARAMARKRVIVKNLSAIENFGSMEILCSDKTGTLTEGEIVLDKHVNVSGDEERRVLDSIYLNSYFEASIKSPMDEAILRHELIDIGGYGKIDEIPFDFNRKILSVVVEENKRRILISKGAAENIFDRCGFTDIDGDIKPFDSSYKEIANQTYRDLSSDGYRVLGVAVRELENRDTYSTDDEIDMTFMGFAAFLDPPKEGVKEVIDQLKTDKVSVVIMTGDNRYVTQKVARDVGIPSDRIIVSSDVDEMDDAALAYQAANGAIFAQVSPEQKNRVIAALKARGYVVGYLGDGINDAPSMHASDIAISVMNGVDVAKDTAHIILMEKDLKVLHDGIIEGRKSFANIMKYIIMGTSSNFGNMFSMALASLFLKFLPMLPAQILLNNFLYDSSQISIPTDNVEKFLLRRPKRWNINFIREFMFIIGPVSSLYDFITFAILLGLFHADEKLFHTGWFVESLTTQTLVVMIIRTTQNPFKGRPSPQLVLSVIGVIVVAFVLPFLKPGAMLGFVPMPPALIGAILLLTVTYLGLVQLIKSWFYRHHELI